MKVAVIPARGGSKRIPRKNIRLFHGQPMIAWAIAAAEESQVFDRIIVSTDDEEIAEVSREHGAEVPFTRPAEISGDLATTDEVFVHALDWLEQEGALPEFLCCIYPSVPFLTGESIRKVFAVLRQFNADSAFTAATFAHPVWRGLSRNTEGWAEYQWPEHRSTRSQDLPELIHDAGQCYWFRVVTYRQNPRLINDRSVPVVLPRWRVQDIDNEEDWMMAERLFTALHSTPD